MISDFIDEKALAQAFTHFKNDAPFDHCIIDGFFTPEVAKSLEEEFPAYDDQRAWYSYNNAIEKKRVCNNWNIFPKTTYQVFSLFNSLRFRERLAELSGIEHLYADHGLNGGGWHIHGPGGKLNTHLDYSIHPKLFGLQRKLNLLVYMTSGWEEEWGGKLGLWAHDEANRAPGPLVKSVSPQFNRAVLFDTTQNSWHGLPEPITCPEGQYRRSLAVYFLADPAENASPRGKALFAPTEEQRDDPEVLDLIEKRSNVATAHKVYR